MNTIQQINSLVGNIDLYLLDYILKDRFRNCQKVFDAGCGEGRNLRFFVTNEYDVYGLDRESLAVKMARMTYPSVSADHFICGELARLPFMDNFFDLVLSSAVLHFSENASEFRNQWQELTRVTSTGGLLFLRMASLWGNVSASGFSWYLTDDLLGEMLGTGWKLADPPKTVLVEKKRSMSVLLFERR
jgi:tellurite methyltransferase